MSRGALLAYPLFRTVYSDPDRPSLVQVRGSPFVKCSARIITCAKCHGKAAGPCNTLRLINTHPFTMLSPCRVYWLRGGEILELEELVGL